MPTSTAPDLTPATRSVVGLAGSLVVDGVRHPVAAAVARSARMATLADAEAFAARLGIDAFTLRRCEAGVVPFAALPAAYLALLDEVQPPVDLVGLRALAEQVDPDDGQAHGSGEVHAVDFSAPRRARGPRSARHRG